MRLLAILIGCLLSTNAFAQTTQTFGNYVNGLPVASSLGNSDQLYVRQGGVSKQILGSAIPSLTNIPTLSGNNTFTGSNTFTAGSITVPTQPSGTNNTTAASTAFVQQNSQPTISLYAFGAKCDGVTDDTSAIQNWLNYATSHVNSIITAPGGTCIFSSALSAVGNQYAIVGAGPYQTIFLYTGTNTTIDLFTFGNIGSANRLHLSGFAVRSNTVMTGGTALHFEGITRSFLDNIVADGQDGNGNLWNGFWFDGNDDVHFSDFEARSQNDALRVNGNSAGRADLFLTHCKIAGSGVGVRIGGNFGGLDIDDCDVIGNGTNVSIDQTLNATANREIFFGKATFIDSASTGPGISITDTGGGFLFLTGTWIASSHTNGIQVASGVNMTIVFAGGTIFNNQSDGINDATSSTATYVITGTKITSNGQSGTGYGINALNSNPKIQFSGIYFSGNATGNYSTNVVNSNFENNFSNTLTLASSNSQGLLLKGSTSGQSQLAVSSTGSLIFNNNPNGASIIVNDGSNGQMFSISSNGINSIGTITSGKTGGTSGELTLNGSTSGSGGVLANSGGSIAIFNNQGGQNTIFNDGGNGTAFIVGGAGGSIANKLTVTPAQTGNNPSLSATGSSDTNVGINLTTKGTGTVAVTNGIDVTSNSYTPTTTFPSTTAPFGVVESLTGTCTTSPSNCWNNYIYVTSDNAVVGSGTSGTFVSLTDLYINHIFGGSAMTGQRSAATFLVTQSSTTGNTAQGVSYGALNAYVTATANDNGTGVTSSTGRGQIETINFIAKLGSSATNFLAVQGGEVDIHMLSGSSSYEKVGWQIVQLSDDAVQGSVVDAALVVTNSSTAVGWKNGIQFGGALGFWPFSSSAIAITCASPCGTLSEVMDFSGATISTAFLKGPGFTVSGIGEMVLGGPTVTDNGKITLNGSTSGSSSLVASSTGGLTAALTVSTPFIVNDGGNGSILLMEGIGGSIANRFDIFPAQTGFGPRLSAVGSDTNVNIRLVPQGAGIVDILGNGGINLEGTSSGTVSITTQAAAGTYNFNLPTSAGSSGAVLTSGGGSTSPMTWTQGLATKTCTINTTNVATGITITITNGLITGTTTC